MCDGQNKEMQDLFRKQDQNFAVSLTKGTMMMINTLYLPIEHQSSCWNNFASTNIDWWFKWRHLSTYTKEHSG